tara:strand:+ start:3481 stop:4365 length:885 start_codon:yes stop_codon:yes gene_type:complete
MNNLLVVFKKNHEQVHDGALSTVISTLDKAKQTYGFEFRTVPREEVERDDFMGPEAVIVLGGDGTLTSIAHSVDDQTLVMGVNSHPMDSGGSGSFGFFMGSDPTRFPQDLDHLLRGSCIINTIPRLQAEIMSTSGNIIRSDPALNDLLVANTHQYQPSKYRLKREGNPNYPKLDVRQSSSGLLFSTFLGQGAWFRHVVDLSMFEFSMSEVNDHYLVVSRDLPSNMRAEDGSHWAWTDQTTTLTSDMHRGYVVADGWDEIHFTRGARISVNNNGPKLRLVTFSEDIYSRVSALKR